MLKRQTDNLLGGIAMFGKGAKPAILSLALAKLMGLRVKLLPMAKRL
jgi:hypothetical protein